MCAALSLMPTSTLRPQRRLSRRWLSVLIALGVVASGCGGDAPSEIGAGVGAARIVADVPSTTTTPLPTTPLPRTSVVVSEPSIPRVVDPLATSVAHIRQEVAVLEAFVEPDGEPATFEFAVTNPTYFGNPLALMITDRTEDGRWLRVQVPVRPNGTEAWIRTEDALESTHRFRAEVRLGDRSLTVWDGEEVVVETSTVIGRPATPTPLGRFFVNDFVEKFEGSAYGPHVLSLSAFSETLETFGGGIPVIAIHGTNRPDLMGGAHSNGCIRIPNEIVTLLAATVPVGTPVDIVA